MDSLAVQWLGLLALTARTWVQSLVGELRSHKMRGAAKKKSEEAKNPDNSVASVFFFFLIYLFYFWLLGLHCCAWAFSSCRERGLLFVAVRRLLIAVASLVAEHGL